MRTTIAILLLCSASGCASQNASQNVRNGPPAYVDTRRALQREGYMDAIAAYDRDINTLAQSERVAAFANMGQQFDAASGSVQNAAANASRRIGGLRPRDLSHVRMASGVVRSVAPQREAYGAALQERAARAHDLREQQFREKEATVALDFERSHAQQRLRLRLRLATHAYLDPALRGRLQRGLAALDAQEAAAVVAQRQRDAAELADYDGTLHAAESRDLGAMNAEAAQHQAAMASIPAPRAGSLPAAIAHPKLDSGSTARAFDAAGSRIASRFGELKASDARARDDANAEIARLKRDRDALYAQAVAAIGRRADRVAAQQHLGRVYTSGAPAGARDITDEL